MLLMFRPCTLTEEHGGNVQKPALLRHHIYKVLLQYYKARAIQVQFCIKTGFYTYSLFRTQMTLRMTVSYIYNAIAPYFKVKKLWYRHVYVRNPKLWHAKRRYIRSFPLHCVNFHLYCINFLFVIYNFHF